MKLSQPFYRLPFRFDAARLAAEAEALDAAAWMPHPSGLKGNSAVALISRDAGDNHDFAGRMELTPHLERCPYHRQVMAAFGEVLTRSRLMKLDAGCEVGEHVDFNYHWYSRVRMHIPVSTNPHVRFRCGDETVHMAAGECWIFDNWRRHRVINDSGEDRIHLVIDLAGSSRFWALVAQAREIDIHADTATLDGLCRFVPFDPDKPATVTAESFNLAPVMAPGEVDALTADLIDDFDACPENNPGLVRRYRTLLEDFARDWRVTWLQFGSQPAGVPHYRRLIERTAARLDPDRQALVTASNGIGVNAVIMQRILRPCLSEEMFGQ